MTIMKLSQQLAAVDPALSVEVVAQKFSHPQLLEFNHDLADELGLGLEGASEVDLALIFSGQKKADPQCSPRAFVYAGHQFGHFNPQLGDGRAMLLGEVLKGDTLFDLQLKGSGRTPFSRRGDGLSALGPVIREMILCEFMHQLNVPTTRGLCAVVTGDQVIRQEVVPGGVFTRVARGHLRIGSFEYFAARSEWPTVKRLIDYAIQRYYPEALESQTPELRFFELFSERTLDLVATWMSYGFIHGVMNTDNMSISGETIDYGPCAFLDEYQKEKVFSSIDQLGRYRYNNQGKIALWNLSAFAQCLVPFIAKTPELAIAIFQEKFVELEAYFEKKLLEKMAAKFGLTQLEKNDQQLIDLFLNECEKNQLDFTQSFTSLTKFWQGEDELTKKISPEFFKMYQKRGEGLISENSPALALMKKANPLLIARNHQVERAIADANLGNYATYFDLRTALSDPFTLTAQNAFLLTPPATGERVLQTFCGT